MIQEHHFHQFFKNLQITAIFHFWRGIPFRIGCKYKKEPSCCGGRVSVSRLLQFHDDALQIGSVVVGGGGGGRVRRRPSANRKKTEILFQHIDNHGGHGGGDDDVESDVLCNLVYLSLSRLYRHTQERNLFWGWWRRRATGMDAAIKVFNFFFFFFFYILAWIWRLFLHWNNFLMCAI